VLPKFFSYGVNLITLPILTRFLVPREFGVVAMAQLFPSVAVSVLTFGLSTAAQRFYFEYKDDHKKLSMFIFSIQLFLYLSFVISSVAIFYLRNIISRLTIGDSIFGMAIFVAFMAGFLANIATFYFKLYQNMEKAAIHSTLTMVQAAVTAVSGVILVCIFKASYMGILLGLLLGSAVVCVIMFFNFNRSLSFDFSPAILWDNLKYGLQVVPKAFTGFVAKFFDKYMLNNMLSLSVVGVYNVGQIVGNAVFFLMGKICAAFQPVYYGEVFQKGDGASVHVGRLFTKFAYISLASVLFVILFAQELIHILAPKSYYEAIDVIIILTAGVSTQIFGMYSGVQYAYSKKAYWIFPITIVATVVNVITNIILIPKLGLLGASIATVVFYFFINGLLTFIGQKAYKINYEWMKLAALYFVIAVSTLVILYFRNIEHGPAIIYPVKIGLLMLFCFVGVKIKVITKQSIKRVKNSLLGFLPKGMVA
jgi:O-antigen/teichoic acid export membrane protein